MLAKMAFEFAVCIPLLFFLLPFPSAAAEEEMALEIAELKAQMKKTMAMIEKLERKMEEMEYPSLKFAGRETEEVSDIVKLQLEVVNVIGCAMKFTSADEPCMQMKIEGLEIEHNDARAEVITLPANLPIPFKKNVHRPYIPFYFEMEMLKNTTTYPMFGFWKGDSCTPGLHLGLLPDSFGIYGKQYVYFHFREIPEKSHEFEFAPPIEQSNLNVGDVLGIGMLHSPGANLTLFAAANEHYLGSMPLPSSLLNLDMFPAITMFHRGERVRINFGKEVWKFNPMRLLSNE